MSSFLPLKECMETEREKYDDVNSKLNGENSYGYEQTSSANDDSMSCSGNDDSESCSANNKSEANSEKDE